MEGSREAIFERLKHSLQLLASQPEIQLRLLPSFVCRADELALDFDQWREMVLHNYAEDLSPDRRSALALLDEKLTWLTTNGKEHWTDQAIKESDEWKNIRALAVIALNTFGWSIETPPSHSREYRSGGRIEDPSQN
jgi:hypothetical protein